MFMLLPLHTKTYATLVTRVFGESQFKAVPPMRRFDLVEGFQFPNPIGTRARVVIRPEVSNKEVT